MPPEIDTQIRTGALALEWITGQWPDDHLAGEWNALVGQSPMGTIFQRFEWLGEWWRMQGGFAANVAILLIRSRGTLVAILPMYYSVGGRWRYLRLLGEGDSDYCNFVFHPACEDPVWEMAIGAIRKFCKINDLHGLVATDLPTLHVAEHFSKCGLSHRVIDVVRCPYVPLPDTWEAFLKGVAKNKRLEIPRYLRRLEKRFEVSFRSSHEDDASREETLERLFEIHTRYWHARGLPGVFPSRQRVFHRAVAASLKDQLRLYQIALNGVPRAIFYGYFYQGRMFSYQTGVDPDFTQDRLGTLIFGHAIRRTIDEGGIEFDFARGDEPYKSQTWRALRDRFNSSVVVPISPRSRAVFHLSRGNEMPGHGLRDVARMIVARLGA